MNDIYTLAVPLSAFNFMAELLYRTAKIRLLNLHRYSKHSNNI